MLYLSLRSQSYDSQPTDQTRPSARNILICWQIDIVLQVICSHLFKTNSWYIENIMEWCKVYFTSFEITWIYIFIDWSLSGIMTSKHVIRESESPRPNGLVDSDFTNDAFLGHYPIPNTIHQADKRKDWFLLIKHYSTLAIEFNIPRHYSIRNNF